MAQERKKRRIVLTSILKPVDDTRLFEKMGISLAQTGDYEVFIVAYPSASNPSGQDIKFISLHPFMRLSLARVMAKWKVFIHCWKLKPSIIIFNTHELLLPSILLKVVMDVKIVYDVRENYYRNIRYTESFPWFIRWPLALMVRFKEKLLAPAVDHFILAEKGYEKEFRFHRGGWTVIENKALESNLPVIRQREPGKIRLLFSGTLAESTGVFRAIQLAKELRQMDSSVTLTIVGYAALKNVKVQLQNESNLNPWISLIGIDRLVPHQTILSAIQRADAGILSYPYSPHTHNAHPTKLFEYLQARLPIILEDNWPWINHFAVYQPFIFCDFLKPDGQTLLEELKTKSFYSLVPEDVSWKSEVLKFLNVLEKI